jgi:predicted DNA-binding protein with PD1-like motif
MNIIASSAATELIVLGLAPGEPLLESIQRALVEKDIRSGVVISGIGTLKNLRMHYILHTDFPAADEIVNIVRPLELVNVSGVIADGQPHLHVTVSCGQNEVWSGHLEEGSIVAYLAEIAILKCTDLDMVRSLDPSRNIKLLARKPLLRTQD